MRRSGRPGPRVAILPTVVGQLVEGGADEQNAWRHPLDLVSLLATAFEALPARPPG